MAASHYHACGEEQNIFCRGLVLGQKTSFFELSFCHAAVKGLKETSKEEAGLREKGDMRGLSFWCSLCCLCLCFLCCGPRQRRRVVSPSGLYWALALPRIYCLFLALHKFSFKSVSGYSCHTYCHRKFLQGSEKLGRPSVCDRDQLLKLATPMLVNGIPAPAHMVGMLKSWQGYFNTYVNVVVGMIIV
jgi:hypothetical protein